MNSGTGLGRKRRIHHHDERRTGNACDRRGVADEIEFELIVERSIDGICRRSHKKPSLDHLVGPQSLW
jgi:hypothetical protein